MKGDKKMERFGELLRRIRNEKMILLKEVAKISGYSIGLLSDIEHLRASALSDEDAIMKIERLLDLKDRSLLKAAVVERADKKEKKELYKTLAEPQLALLRASSDMTAEEINEWVSEMAARKQRKGSQYSV